jgi:DNA-binding MarR family transcriptional regulator
MSDDPRSDPRWHTGLVERLAEQMHDRDAGRRDDIDDELADAIVEALAKRRRETQPRSGNGQPGQNYASVPDDVVDSPACPTCKAIFGLLDRRQMKGGAGEAFSEGYAELGRRLGIQYRTVSDHVADLVAAGWVEVIKTSATSPVRIVVIHNPSKSRRLFNEAAKAFPLARSTREHSRAPRARVARSTREREGVRPDPVNHSDLDLSDCATELDGDVASSSSKRLAFDVDSPDVRHDQAEPPTPSLSNRRRRAGAVAGLSTTATSFSDSTVATPPPVQPVGLTDTDEELSPAMTTGKPLAGPRGARARAEPIEIEADDHLRALYDRVMADAEIDRLEPPDAIADVLARLEADLEAARADHAATPTKETERELAQAEKDWRIAMIGTGRLQP